MFDTLFIPHDTHTTSIFETPTCIHIPMLHAPQRKMARQSNINLCHSSTIHNHRYITLYARSTFQVKMKNLCWTPKKKTE